MKGRGCRCGFTTTSDRPRCPRCGKQTSQRVWEDRGEVLSYSRLMVTPEGGSEKMALALVRVHGNGPKVACWSLDRLAPGDQVSVEELGRGRYRCSRVGR